jgi:hypothetical protein
VWASIFAKAIYYGTGYVYVRYDDTVEIRLLNTGGTIRVIRDR